MHEIVVDVIMNSNVTSLGDLPDITILALQLLVSLTHSLSIAIMTLYILSLRKKMLSVEDKLLLLSWRMTLRYLIFELNKRYAKKCILVKY